MIPTFDRCKLGSRNLSLLTVVLGQNVTLETVVTRPWGCLLGLTEEGYLGDVEIVEGGGDGGVL